MAGPHYYQRDQPVLTFQRVRGRIARPSSRPNYDRQRGTTPEHPGVNRLHRTYPSDDQAAEKFGDRYALDETVHRNLL